MKRVFATFLASVSFSLGAAEFDQVYEGLYSWGPEVHSFTPCGDETSYWVSFDWAGAEMHEHYKQYFDNPYQPMFIEFRGHILDEKVDGFAEEYDGLIRVSDVHRFTFDIPGRCNGS